MAERTFDVYCGNFDCASRRAGVTFRVIESELVDGESWLCIACRPDTVDVETELV